MKARIFMTEILLGRDEVASVCDVLVLPEGTIY